ncbi:hypothetical protein M9Y10_015260 [Tritrichomonas musculus]|uniref:MSP domain-containing protein n=1 Tax=Tritrichomonas musculus TaxID=1915356 RepID=A0ABR2L2L1_9EUKA
MNVPQTKSNKIFPIGLNIHLLSFTLPKDVIKSKDDIRVSITTMPEQNKQHFHLHGKKMHCTNHVFSLNITNQTKRIIMVFRKKTFLSEDPIIASTIIYSLDFPKIPGDIDRFESEPISTDVKTLNIYYPLQKQIREQGGNINNVQDKKITRKVLGQMQVQLTFTTPYTSVSQKKTIKNNNKSNKISKSDKHNNKNNGTKLHKNKKGNYEEINSQNQFEHMYINSN